MKRDPVAHASPEVVRARPDGMDPTDLVVVPVLTALTVENDDRHFRILTGRRRAAAGSPPPASKLCPLGLWHQVELCPAVVVVAAVMAAAAAAAVVVVVVVQPCREHLRCRINRINPK